MSNKTPNLNSYIPLRSFAAGASRANGAGVRAKDHLKKALAEVDGLLAGLTYLDTTERSTPAAENALPDDLEREIHDLEIQASPEGETQSNNGINTTETPSESRRRDWSCIRDVRDGMELLWRDFDKLATKLNTKTINELRGGYDNAQGLREAGVFAFRNTLTGPTPNNLKSIFAFTGLSYVVSCLLRDRKRLPEDSVLSGVQIWMNAIQDRDERYAFATLAKDLWPEAKNHIQFLDFCMTEKGWHGGEVLRGDQWASVGDGAVVSGPDAFLPQHTRPVNLLSPTIPSADQYQTPAIQNYNPGPVQQYPFDYTNLTPGQGLADHVMGLTDQTFETFELFQFMDVDAGSLCFPGTDKGGPSGLPPEMPSFDQTGSMSQTESDDMTDDEPMSDTSVSREALQNTPLFLALSTFLKDMYQLLYILSGMEMTARLLEKQRHIDDRIDQDYIWPLLTADGYEKDTPSERILWMARKFVRSGHLQTVEEVRAYMTIIGLLIFDVGNTALQRFLEWINTPRITQSSSPPKAIPVWRLWEEFR
ncbi:hypothetical protein B0J13DRAFT_655535 [Dactylonectria estremocensis]|uniref:Uncharacterized protein n=1 Tax=Dactylonectria estremocensis TaxID=1079267 RepID=A0A9P9F8K4_9HYPO|nr:hypothetical protein B0J13DRAFT_655535 [Dactylonectria estremocensis]